MKKAITRPLMLAVALMFATSIWAQTDNAQATSNPSNSNQVTLRGCLQGGAGTYVLLDKKTGVAYILKGAEDELAKNIHHQIEITGEPQVTASSAKSSGGTPPTINNFKVVSVREISNHCEPPQAP